MATKDRRAPRLPQREIYTLKDLDQVKVLADPLRIRILEALLEERTTKQVADLLGEKPTKLYHHVDALEKVGLIALSRTRQNRGTVEKYYLAVARTFRADLGTYHYAGDLEKTKASGAFDQLTFDYIRDAGAAMVGDPDRCIALARAMAADGVTIGVFPEQVIGGYAPEDLVQWRGFVESQRRELLRFAGATAELGAAFALGLVVGAGGDLYNVAALVHRGAVL